MYSGRWKHLCSSRDGVHLRPEKDTCRLVSLSKWIELYEFRPTSVFIRQYLWLVSALLYTSSERTSKTWKVFLIYGSHCHNCLYLFPRYKEDGGGGEGGGRNWPQFCWNGPISLEPRPISLEPRPISLEPRPILLKRGSVPSISHSWPVTNRRRESKRGARSYFKGSRTNTVTVLPPQHPPLPTSFLQMKHQPGNFKVFLGQLFNYRTQVVHRKNV